MESDQSASDRTDVSSSEGEEPSQQFTVEKIHDPIGIFPKSVRLKIDAKGILFSSVSKALFYTDMKNIKLYGHGSNRVLFKLKYTNHNTSDIYVFQFRSKDAEEINKTITNFIKETINKRILKRTTIAEAVAGMKRIYSATESIERVDDELIRDDLQAARIENLRLVKRKGGLEQRVTELEKEFNDKRNQLYSQKALDKKLSRDLEDIQRKVKELENKLKLKENDIKKTDDEIKKDAERVEEIKVQYETEKKERKTEYNKLQVLKGNIRVFCRWRPMNKNETKAMDQHVLTAVDEYTVEHVKNDKTKSYIFDQVFSESASQQTVFQETKYLVQSAIDGFNVCVFAYGQTGSGKTFTIHGSDADPGLTPRGIEELFKSLEANSDKCTYSVQAYMVELYMDNLEDLLSPKNTQTRPKLKIKTGAINEIENVTMMTVKSATHLKSILDRGVSRRKTSGTKMNAESSRSHLVFSVIIQTKDVVTGSLVKGKLSFVDLAGSECSKKTGAKGIQMSEATSINLSLTNLRMVFRALATKGRPPYRDNKLTLLLQDSLGGNAKTLMFVNVSPASSNAAETQSSLDYGISARQVTNTAIMNVTKPR